ncbi:hypothetical protein Leryth_025981 [Lithospermum erythrorhizon]|nr:hypothetical protein Leryth_025981 [Lithospermum erythrorhizon]
MDLPSLSIILHGALSHNPHQRKAAELSLTQYQYTPQHLVRLLQIIVDGNCEMAVRQVASIHFKNFVSKNWSPHEPGEQSKILPGDKELVRQHILNFIVQVPPLLRVQLGECVKTLIHSDYPEQWPALLHWVKHNLQDQQVFGALFVLRILARKYEFKSDEERIPISFVIEETFPHLLNMFNRLVQIDNPSIEISELIKLICKIFWSSIYLEIPKHLFDPNIFNAWMVLLLNILERPVSLEGQPTDLDQRKSWGWWKVKKWTVHILNRLYTRFGDLKLQNPDNRAFAQIFQKTYAGKILECHLNLLSVIRVGGYLPDRVINLILQYLSNSISKSNMYNILQPRLDIVLFEIVFPLMCFNDNDQRLWEEDPHEYVRKGYDIIEDLYSPRTAAMDFVSELVRKRGKENLQKFILFIVEVFKRYDESSTEYKSYRQKDGALLAIGSVCDKLKQTDSYKSEVERMLVQHVFPEFSNPVGHLRAKAAWVAGQYAHITFSDPNNFRRALQSVVAGMRDPDLPVRVDSVFALRSYVEACNDLDEIRPILPQLLDELFKVMNEVENEDLVFTLETIVDKMRKPILLPIMRRMLTTDGQDVFEETLELVSYMTFFSPTISLDLWSLWPLMMEALSDWAIDFFQNILVPLDNFICRSTAHFLSCKEPDYQQSLWNMISSIMADKNFEDGDIEPAPKLIEAVFQSCKGRVDQWIEPYIRISVERLRRTEKPYLKCLLLQVVANALYYNAALTLGILQKLGVATDIFALWFQMLQQTKRSGMLANFKKEQNKKVCCLGLTSLLNLPADQMPLEALARVFKAILDLLVAYKAQLAEAAKDEEEDNNGMGGLATDDEEEDDLSDGEMGADTEDGDEVDSIKLQKLAAQAKAFRSEEEEDDDYSDDDFSVDEELQSPTDDVDPFIFFVDTVQVLQASDPSRFLSLTQSLDLHYQAIASGIAQHADQRRFEIEKEKLEKESSATVATS